MELRAILLITIHHTEKHNNSYCWGGPEREFPALSHCLADIEDSALL